MMRQALYDRAARFLLDDAVTLSRLWSVLPYDGGLSGRERVMIPVTGEAFHPQALLGQSCFRVSRPAGCG